MYAGEFLHTMVAIKVINKVDEFLDYFLYLLLSAISLLTTVIYYVLI